MQFKPRYIRIDCSWELNFDNWDCLLYTMNPDMVQTTGNRAKFIISILAETCTPEDDIIHLFSNLSRNLKLKRAKELSLCHHLYISLQPNVVDLCYFKI